MQTEQITGLELFEKGLTKTDIHCMAQNAIDAVLEQGNALKVGEALSAMEAFIKEIKGDDRFKDYVREECAKYPKGYISPSGAKVELAETGTKYDFSKCDDPIYEMYSQKLLSVQNSLKEREAFLKTVPLEGLEIRFEDELIRVFPPSKSSISSYKITLSK
jgi:hypothetical protein